MSHYRAIASYYDAEYEGAEMLERDVPFFLGHLPKRRQKILEIAAGTGRAGIPLAQAGHRVVGVDYAPEMLKIAERRRDQFGIKPADLKLVRQNALKLDLGEKFDWAVIFFNTFLNFSTLDQQDKLLAGIARHLKPRGRLWLDVFQANLELLAQPHSEQLEPGMFYVPALDRTVTRETEVARDPSTQIQHVTYHYRWFDGEGVSHHETVEFDLTFLFPREMRLLLERHGFRVDTIYGDYDGSKLHADSPRMIVLASKR